MMEQLFFAESQTLLAVYHAAQIPVRFVGGCVRDSLLGLKIHDIDLCTPARPETSREILRQAGISTIPTGIAHGTITALVNHTAFEITTLRRDVSTDGRRATVAYTDSWVEDAERRDFTLNALSCDADGKLYDYCGGLDDLRAGHVRFIGDAECRIREDVLRILRFFRFDGRFNHNSPDITALTACRNLAHLLPTLSIERVRDEILKILSLPRAPKIWDLMLENRIMQYTPLALATDTATLARMVQDFPESDALLRLASLLPESAALPNLALSNADTKRLRKTRILDLPTDRHNLRVMLYREGIATVRDRLNLAKARAILSEPDYQAALETLTTWENPQFPINGDMLQAKGFQPGVALGQELKRLEQRWIDSDFSEKI